MAAQVSKKRKVNKIGKNIGNHTVLGPVKELKLESIVEINLKDVQNNCSVPV